MRSFPRGPVASASLTVSKPCGTPQFNRAECKSALSQQTDIARLAQILVLSILISKQACGLPYFDCVLDCDFVCIQC